MKKYITILTVVFTVLSLAAEAQYRIYGPRPRRVYPPRLHTQHKRPPLPKFQPTLNFSIGYGLPNLDKNELAQFYNTYQGNTITQKGPLTGAVDYQFSRYMSIGVMGAYAKVSAPYYDYASTSAVPDFTGTLENWSIMLNMMNYMPVYGNKIDPYFRTALGINNWKQDYVDANGTKVAVAEEPTQFAYQVSLGARFNLSKQAAFYVEGGYGKYILNGGLTLRF